MIQELLTLWDEYLVWIQTPWTHDEELSFHVTGEPVPVKQASFFDFMEYLRKRGE